MSESGLQATPASHIVVALFSTHALADACVRRLDAGGSDIEEQALK